MFEEITDKALEEMRERLHRADRESVLEADGDPKKAKEIFLSKIKEIIIETND